MTNEDSKKYERSIDERNYQGSEEQLRAIYDVLTDKEFVESIKRGVEDCKAGRGIVIDTKELFGG